MTETKTYEQVIEENGYLYWKTVGVSMRPLIKEGRDMILVKKRPDERLKKYDTVLFRRPGYVGRGAYILHRILKVNPDGTYWIVGDNCYSGETVLDENVFGVLDTVVRKGKKVKTDNFWYKVYVHIWCDAYPIRFFIVRYKHYPRAAVNKLLRALKIKKQF